jgi:hypothetical protein
MPRLASDTEATAWLVAEVPALRPPSDEHLKTFDELLPYVVFESDFTRSFAARVRAGDGREVQSFLAAIEPLFTTKIDPPANDPVWNLAAVAFVQGLQRDRDVVALTRAQMGPNTMRAFDGFFGRPNPTRA